MKKIRRILDGKVYQVHATRSAVIVGITVDTCQDVLVTGADERADDVLQVVGQRMWLDGYRVYQVHDAVPVEVP